ncbi:hypothetical protein H8B06_07530 [Sphingobacterium sp. DN00404]|uniref:Uncharacterized protein n=1 Tax=Sphingobacterium micropteri TaxID=2763501 RepID=A0ABR7YMW0_9SPHI|nr:hypothetical protein [Sphingobacterium micropteri]MBD1432669.1 hypothetical protein [Sphingobacterium micropteri]
MKILKVWLRKVQGLTGRRTQVALPTMVAFWDFEASSRKEPKCFFRTF